MKKIVLLALLTLFINGCRFIKTKEPYLDAHASKELTIPEGVDAPNSTSTLEIPSAKNEKLITEKSNPAPPDMAVRTKQSENGEVKISSENGYPVLSVQTDIDAMWQAMSSLTLAGLSIKDKDRDACVITYDYVDQAAEQRKNDGFFKRFFRRDKIFTDISGLYKISCQQRGSVTNAKFSAADDTRAKTFLADDVMIKLYEKFDS